MVCELHSLIFLSDTFDLKILSIMFSDSSPLILIIPIPDGDIAVAIAAIVSEFI